MSNRRQTSVPIPQWVIRALARPWVHIGLGILILLADIQTGSFLLFPILFVIPVTLCGWYCNVRLAYALAILLPIGRSLIAAFIDHPHPLPFIVANALIRIVVLLFLAFFVVRTARQNKELQQRVNGLVTMCAWSKTIKYQGEWISFEVYLEREFGINTTHGISPAEEQKFREKMMRSRKREAEPSAAPNSNPATSVDISIAAGEPPSVS